MCMEPLGPSLSDLMQFCGGRLSIKTMLMVGKQLLKRLQDLHAQNIVHLDIKPQNTVIGLNDRTSEINLIDFGISEYYRNRKTGCHLIQKEGHYLKGTVRYASRNSHYYLRLSRRDDLESLAYMLIHLSRDGGLPWNPTDGEDVVLEQKESIHEVDLCEGLPMEMAIFLKYIKSLDYSQEPDYDFLHSQLDQAAFKLGIQLNDSMYDWTQKAILMQKYPASYSKILAKTYDFKSNCFIRQRIIDQKGCFIDFESDKKMNNDM